MVNRPVLCDSLPANKIIIKQGHLPENFYFIMSGSGKCHSQKTGISSDILTFDWRVCSISHSRERLPNAMRAHMANVP